MNETKNNNMPAWFFYAVGAAVLYGLHQIFTKLAAEKISDGLGVFWSVLTGICVGVGPIFFFVLFQKGGPLSAVPMILAGGAALMAVAGIAFFKEPASALRL